MPDIEQACPQCGKIWKIPAEHVGGEAECGACKAVFSVKYVATEEAEPATPTEKRKPPPAFSSRKEAVVGYLLFALIIGIGVWLMRVEGCFRGCLSSRRTASPSRRVPAPSREWHNPDLGEIVRIRYKDPYVVVYGAVDNKSWDEMNSAIAATDAAGLDSLKSSGKVLVVKRLRDESGPKAKVIETGWTSHKVRLISAPHRGTAVWVPMEAIQAAEDEEESEKLEKEPEQPHVAPTIDVSEQKRRKIYYELAACEKKAQAVVDIAYSIDPSKSKNWKENVLKNVDMNDALLKKYQREIAKNHGISWDRLLKILVEGAMKDWPAP